MNWSDVASVETMKRDMAKGRWSVKQIDRLLHEFGMTVARKTEREVSNFLLNAFAVALHDEFGFGAQRLQKITDKVLNELECFDKKLVSVEDFKTILRDECKYEIEFRFTED